MRATAAPVEVLGAVTVKQLRPASDRYRGGPSNGAWWKWATAGFSNAVGPGRALLELYAQVLRTCSAGGGTRWGQRVGSGPQLEGLIDVSSTRCSEKEDL